MPLFMDRHDIRDVTSEQVAAAHHEDVQVQGKHSCKALTYWYDEARGAAFCLVEAPSPEAVREMHREAHGLIPHQVIEVDPLTVSQFLGRVEDPADVASNPICESAFRAIVFIDMVSSTDITRALGDDAALALVRGYRDIVRAALLEHRGREVDCAGDGFLTSFESALTAVRCAMQIQAALASDSHAGTDQVAVQAKIGICAGEPVLDGTDLFGSTINLTSRICDHAEPGQILASRVIRHLCMGKGLTFTSQGSVTFKGFDEPTEIDVIAWS